MTEQTVCKKCKGKGGYFYDEQHLKPCEECCAHADGWWKLEKHYGADNGKYACKTGCGTLVDAPPDDENDLIELTREALADALGREPTRQELVRAHAGFKRMAFVMYEHLKHEKKENITPLSTPES